MKNIADDNQSQIVVYSMNNYLYLNVPLKLRKSLTLHSKIGHETISLLYSDLSLIKTPIQKMWECYSIAVRHEYLLSQGKELIINSFSDFLGNNIYFDLYLYLFADFLIFGYINPIISNNNCSKNFYKNLEIIKVNKNKSEMLTLKKETLSKLFRIFESSISLLMNFTSSLFPEDCTKYSKNSLVSNYLSLSQNSPFISSFASLISKVTVPKPSFTETCRLSSIFEIFSYDITKTMLSSDNIRRCESCKRLFFIKKNKEVQCCDYISDFSSKSCYMTAIEPILENKLKNDTILKVFKHNLKAEPHPPSESDSNTPAHMSETQLNEWLKKTRVSEIFDNSDLKKIKILKNSE